MVLTPDSIIQNASGFSVGNGTATIAPTTAGNTVLLVLTATGGALGATGFTSIRANGILAVTANMLWKNTTGGETTFAYTTAVGTAVVNWVCYEVEGLDQSNPVDNVPIFLGGTTASLATSTTSLASTFDGMVLAFHACEDTTSSTPGTWSGHTGGLSELTEVGGNDGVSLALGTSVSMAFTYTAAPQTWASTATKTAPVGQSSTAGIAILTSATAKYAADIAVCTGFEFGTTAGITLSGTGTGTAVFDSSAGTPAIVATSPRSGDYCLELASSAAAESLTWGRLASQAIGATVTSQIPLRLSVYFPSALPGADLVLLTLTPPTAGDATVLRYESSDSTLGLKVGTGTEVFSNQAVTANQWISIDLRVDGRTTTHRADWQIDYDDDGNRTVQTQATATATVVSLGWDVQLGWASASTATVRYDDVVVGRLGGHYPLGNMVHQAITPDPAGTLTVSGSTANFNVMTANGTLAAWNAVNALAAIDERPPTIGASADGIVQVATALADYVEIPMTSISAVNLGAAIRAIRCVACGWAASTLTATIQFRFWDGVTEHQPTGASDYQFDNSTTVPAWYARMVRSTASRPDWTQTKLDALAFRVGFSSDASPAIGIHNIIGEVCFRVGDLIRVIDAMEGLFTVDWRMDPDSSGVIQAIITTPVDRGAHYSITVSGTPIEIDVPPDTVHTEYIGATDITFVTEHTLTPGVG
jgi:hypothetical protein